MSPIPLGIIAASISSSDMELIYSTNLATSSSSISISSIPTTYKHLQLFISSRAFGNVSGEESTYMRLNNNSNNIYSSHVMQAAGDRVLHQSSSASQGQFYIGRDLVAGATANAFGGFVISLWDYANPNTMTTVRSLYGHATNGTGGTYIVGLAGGAFGSTTAVSRIDLFKSSASFAAQTTVSLYGIKA